MEQLEEGSPSKTVARIVDVLECLGRSGIGGCSLGSISTDLGLSKPATLKIMAGLVEARLVHQNDGGRYRLGTEIGTLGLSTVEHYIAGCAIQTLRRLAMVTGDTVFASIREGSAAVCVARDTGTFPIRTLTLGVGDRRPLGVGAGSLAILAFLDDAKIDEVMRRNERWLADYPNFSTGELWNMIERTRRDGFSLNAGRIVPGMNAIGIPVMDRDGNVIAALSLAAIKDRMGVERVPDLVVTLKEEALFLSKCIDLRVC